uniref:Uncharacterized protein n=1 Tax=Glossina palpalis gambiensis TaxID=67801 RepID=A0A1B0C5G5_9MUSC
MVGVMWRRSSSGLFGTITPRLMGSSLVHGFLVSLAVVVRAGSSVVIVRTVIGSAVGVMMVTSSASLTGSLALTRASPSMAASSSSTAAIFIRVDFGSVFHGIEECHITPQLRCDHRVRVSWQRVQHEHRPLLRSHLWVGNEEQAPVVLIAHRYDQTPFVA